MLNSLKSGYVRLVLVENLVDPGKLLSVDGQESLCLLSLSVISSLHIQAVEANNAVVLFITPVLKSMLPYNGNIKA